MKEKISFVTKHVLPDRSVTENMWCKSSIHIKNVKKNNNKNTSHTHKQKLLCRPEYQIEIKKENYKCIEKAKRTVRKKTSPLKRIKRKIALTDKQPQNSEYIKKVLFSTTDAGTKTNNNISKTPSDVGVVFVFFCCFLFVCCCFVFDILNQTAAQFPASLPPSKGKEKSVQQVKSHDGEYLLYVPSSIGQSL